MNTTNDSESPNIRVFEAFTNDLKKFEISMKIGPETDNLIFQLVLTEDSKKKIFCSLYNVDSIKKIEVLSVYNTTKEIFNQICDYIDVNKQLKIKSSITIQNTRAILVIPINSRKYKQLDFELKYENSELIEILLDTIDKLIKKNEDFEKRIKALEEEVFNKKKEEIKKEDNNAFIEKIENLTNIKTLKPHECYISNIILLQNNKIASSSLDHYIKIYNKDTFEEEMSIKESSCVDWIEQIKDGTFISCPRDNTIKLYEIKDKEYKNINVIKQSSSAWKMKELESGKLISTMSNSEIKIWIKKNNTLECEFILENGGESYDILEIRKNEVVTLSRTNVNFYDLNKRDKICSVQGFESFNLNPGKKFCKANEKLLLVCGRTSIFLVDYQNYQLINKIECNNIIAIYKLPNDIILSGQVNGDIKQWKCNDREIKLFSYKSKAHDNGIIFMFTINNTFISSDESGNIKFWELK